MDEHIQIPKSILKPFSTVSHAVNDDGNPIKQNITYVLDVNGNIFPQDIKDCNINKGYYNLNSENHLAQCETAFGDLKTKVLTDIKYGKAISFDEKDINTVKRFFEVCKLRSPYLHIKLIDKLKVMFPKVDFKEFQSHIVTNPPPINLIKNKDKLCVFYNKTDVNFLIPQCCWYLFGRRKQETLFMPISNNVALALCHRHKKDDRTVYPILESEIVDMLNCLAIYTEWNSNRQLIYAKFENDLKRYIPFLEDFKNEIQI